MAQSWRLVSQIADEKSDEMQFGFMPICKNPGVIFILKQLQNTFFAKMIDLYFTFVGMLFGVL